MDIEYLLFLQNFRNNINDALTPFMEWISLFAVTYLIMIPVFVYWCVDKKKGLYTLTSYYICTAVNAVVKLTACVFRPWIRDSRVLPAGDAITTATGYSFPSGHTTTAAPIYGGLAVSAWGKKSLRWLSAVCVVLILLTGFSRNYLGVHTPQDVFVAICEGVFWLIIVSRLLKWVEANPEKEDLLLLVGFALTWIGIAYITFKSYPMKYDAAGELLVNPQKMMNDGYGDIGKLMGFCIGRFIEKRWVQFQSTGLSVKGILTAAIGLIPMWLMIAFVEGIMIAALGGHWGKLIFHVLMVVYCVAIYPLFIKMVTCKR